jgi:hypothetical protein
MSLSEDAKNKFDRQRPQTPTSLEQKNRFDREKDRRNAQRGDTSKHDARVEKIADQNAKWVNKNFQPVAAGGTPLPPDLAKMKLASDASRTELKRTPVTSVSVESLLETITALNRDWKANTESGKNYAALFEDNEWNKVQMGEMEQHLIKGGHPINAQLPEATFLRCYNGGHLDPRKRRDRAGNIVHLRGEARRPAPIPVPHCVWEDETVAVQAEQAQQALATATAETARAKSLPFDQLKQEATRDRKSERALMGPVW